MHAFEYLKGNMDRILINNFQEQIKYMKHLFPE